MDAFFRVEMLGRFGVRLGNREITRFRTQKTASLLARLAFYRSLPQPRDLLIEQFWPDSDLEAARTNLSVALNALRRQLEPPGVPPGAVLIADRSQVCLNPVAFTTDVEDLERILGEAQAEPEAERRAELWSAAIELYRGDLLPGFYEDWILTERERLRSAILAALRQAVKDLAKRREYDQAIEYSHRMIQMDPLREGSCRDLMRLYLAVGLPQDALHQYEELERRMRDELQAAPSAATRELAEQLRQISSRPSKTTESRDPRPRQKEAEAEARPSTTNTKRPTAKIPFQFTRFFGQEEESKRLEEALVGPDGHFCRLITLTGPGGTGKTRLSVEVASRVGDAFSGSVWFVPLADLDDPLRLGEAIRDVLELPRQSSPPAMDQVIAFLNGLEKPSLLILDNFEQIAGGGAAMVWTLLNRVPSLRCLVTSRQPLSLPGEREVPVRPLPAPTGNHSGRAEPLLTVNLLTYPSVALFVDRARAARPEFQITPRNAGAVAAICARLEGIPLAIELAAARAKTLSPSQILERLSERFEVLSSRRVVTTERHQSLWAAIDWSYRLLSPELQRFFAQLSVFRGGWSLEAAEEVAGSNRGSNGVMEFWRNGEATQHSTAPTLQHSNTPTLQHSLNAVDALSQLRGHSLILAEESSATIRFRMLETLREFAAEQLTKEQREETERRHADFFHRCVTGAQQVGSDKTVWFERFEEDLDNLRVVFAWSLREGNKTEIGLRTAGTLTAFWVVHGHLSEGRRWFARLLERAGESPTKALGQALYGAGALASQQGDFEAAGLLLERALKIAYQLGDDVHVAASHNELGSVTYCQGDYEQARYHYSCALELARKEGRRDRVASVLGNLANVAQSVGESDDSRALNEQSLALWREVGDRLGEARTLNNLGKVALWQVRLEEARTYYEQSLALKRELGDRFGLIGTLNGIGDVALAQGDVAAATAYAREALALAREMNVPMHLVNILHLLIQLARAIGESEIAVRMCGAMETAREEIDYPLTAVEQAEYERAQAALQESLGAQAYESAKSEGGKYSLEQALACLEETLHS